MIIKDGPLSTLKLELTIPKCFIRYTPDGGRDRLEAWVEKIFDWNSRGLTDAYFYIDSEDKLSILGELTRFKQLIAAKGPY